MTKTIKWQGRNYLVANAPKGQATCNYCHFSSVSDACPRTPGFGLMCCQSDMTEPESAMFVADTKAGRAAYIAKLLGANDDA